MASRRFLHLELAASGRHVGFDGVGGHVQLGRDLGHRHCGGEPVEDGEFTLGERLR
jgi:hypothetical protein